MNFWAKLGISVPVIALYSIIVTEALRHQAYYEVYRWHGCIGLVVGGVLMWFMGKLLSPRRSEDPNAVGPGLLSSIFQAGYWGPMLVIFGAVLIFIVPKPKQAKVARAAETTAPAQQAAPEKSFPELSIQGVIYRQHDPCALINGRTLFIGEAIEGARLISVEHDRATLEWEGNQRTLVIGTRN